jgi:hypothetical protein
MGNDSLCKPADDALTHRRCIEAAAHCFWTLGTEVFECAQLLGE